MGNYFADEKQEHLYFQAFNWMKKLFQVEEALQHNTAKLDETLTKVEIAK